MSACDQVVDALAEGRRPDGALRAHLDDCPGCRAVVDADAALQTVTEAAPVESEEMLPLALREALRRDARPVAGFSPWRSAAPAVALALAGAVMAVLAVPRADLAHQSTARLGVGLVAGAAGLLGSLALLLHGGRRGVGLPAPARWAFVVGAGACFAAVTAGVTVPVEGSVHLAGAAAWQARVGCGLHGSLFGAAVGALVFYGARRTAAADPVAAGAVAGLAAGFTGALAQHLTCPVMDLDHSLVAHVAPLVLGALLGALAGRRWLAP